MEGEEDKMVAARNEFVERALAEYESPLIGYAVGFLHDVERARDVVQDTFIRLYQQDEEKVKKGLKAWLFTVCRNRSLDILRKDKRLVELKDKSLAVIPDGGHSPSESADRGERVRQVLRALEKLPENQREVVRLKFEQDMSYQEISEVTGLTSGNVGFILHTALKKLRAVLPDDLLNEYSP